MRELIVEVYPGIEWRSRVKCMRENQVLAIYTRFLDAGKFDKKEEVKEWEQLKMF